MPSWLCGQREAVVQFVEQDWTVMKDVDVDWPAEWRVLVEEQLPVGSWELQAEARDRLMRKE